MKRICQHIKILWITALLLVGCDGEGTLLDLYPWEPIVNAETGILIQDNELLYARLSGRQQLDGITVKGWFATSDFFKSFDFTESRWPDGEGVLSAGKGVVVHAVPGGAVWSIRFSVDDGKTWEAVDGPATDVSLIQVTVNAPQTVWLLGRQETDGNSRLLLYRMDVSDKQVKLRFAKDHTLPLAVGFSDGDLGWLLDREQLAGAEQARVWKTADGGQAWTEVGTIGGIASPSLTVVDADRLLVYNRSGQAFHSSDGGRTFEAVSVGARQIISCQAVGGEFVYALLGDGLAKSSDGGKTWRLLDAQAPGVGVSGTAMDFYDERRGIVYGPDRLFMTSDGGESWEIGVYPYDYVFE